MKLRHLLLGMLAMAATVACDPVEPEVTPELNVNKTEASVAADGGSVAVQVTANVDWTATADMDWVSVNPASGNGNATVTLTVAPNEAEAARTANVTVRADKLSKTVKVTQAGKASDPTPEPEPEPEPEAKTYILVGEAVGGWDPTNNGVILTLKDGYYTAKSVAVAAKKGMHFTKNSSWEGNVKGLHGLIAPNEIGEVGSNDISLTEGGNFDVYLTEALDKFYFMSEGKLPSEAVQHQEIAVTWGVIGATKSGAWSTDYVMTQEGEWYVAKAVEFAEVNLKVRGNSSWADDVKWGRAAQDTECKLNAAIAVSTCTEYKAANPSEGDNPNIYVGGEGTYDVYFSPDKKEVWIMTPGYKPGDQVPGGDEPGTGDGNYDIDGKQWTFTWQAMGGVPCVIDFGVTQPGLAILAYDLGALDPSYAGIIYPYIVGEYSITKTDGTSGVVTLSADGVSLDIPYSNATATTVHFDSEAFLYENVDCTLATSFIEISLDLATGLADGQYWIMSDGKVATPLSGNYGYIQVADAVDGRSTAANAFTFTQVEDGLYTIQDSNGKYYYQTGDYNSFNVSATDGGTDEYLWEVYDSGNGEYVIFNYATGKFIQYDTQYNSYGCYMDERGNLPVLVLAENPVTEPEPDPTPGEGLAHPLTSNIEWTLGNKAYSDKATVNGNADVSVLKLGTSDTAGDATVVIPAGTTKVGFYGVAWKNKTGTLTASSDAAGGKFFEQTFVSNAGASNQSPYTIDVTDQSDYYEIDVVALLGSACPMDLPVTLSTVTGATRVIIFGLNYYTK